MVEVLQSGQEIKAITIPEFQQCNSSVVVNTRIRKKTKTADTLGMKPFADLWTINLAVESFLAPLHCWPLSQAYAKNTCGSGNLKH